MTKPFCYYYKFVNNNASNDNDESWHRWCTSRQRQQLNKSCCCWIFASVIASGRIVVVVGSSASPSEKTKKARSRNDAGTCIGSSATQATMVVAVVIVVTVGVVALAISSVFSRLCQPRNSIGHRKTAVIIRTTVIAVVAKVIFCHRSRQPKRTKPVERGLGTASSFLAPGSHTAVTQLICGGRAAAGSAACHRNCCATSSFADVASCFCCYC